MATPKQVPRSSPGSAPRAAESSDALPEGEPRGGRPSPTGQSEASPAPPRSSPQSHKQDRPGRPTPRGHPEQPSAQRTLLPLAARSRLVCPARWPSPAGQREAGLSGAPSPIGRLRDGGGRASLRRSLPRVRLRRAQVAGASRLGSHVARGGSGLSAAGGSRVAWPAMEPGEAGSGASAVLREGWFRETCSLWPGQALSLQVEEVLHHRRSRFQEILVFRRWGRRRGQPGGGQRAAGAGGGQEARREATWTRVTAPGSLRCAGGPLACTTRPSLRAGQDRGVFPGQLPEVPLNQC